MKKSISLKQSLIFMAIAFLLMIVMGMSFLIPSAVVGASEGNEIDRTVSASSDFISVSPRNRNNPDANADEYNISDLPTFAGVPITRVDWKYTSKFVVGLNQAKIAEIEASAPYTYTIKVEFLQVEPTQAGTFDNRKSETIKTSSGNLTELSQIIDFDYTIKDKKSNDSDIFGWGIYRFSLQINNQSPYYSNFYFVKPENVVPTTELIKLTEEEIAPDVIGNKRMKYTIESEDYKYINQNLIRWYVSGETYDGAKYAYHINDIGSDDFPTIDYKSNALHTAIEDRETGSSTFEFETSVAGKWNVYCVIFKEVPANRVDNIHEAQAVRSETKGVTTGKEIQASYVIWIVIAVAVVLLGVIIFVIVKSVKKEKVW